MLKIKRCKIQYNAFKRLAYFNVPHFYDCTSPADNDLHCKLLKKNLFFLLWLRH